MAGDRSRKRQDIKHYLLEKLREEHAFWSYSAGSIDDDNITDDQLVALTMRYLDLPEINMLFQIYPLRKIKNAWKKLLVPEGAYLYTLNRFFAWYYFKAKKTDTYLKSLETRQLNHTLSFSK